MKQKVRLVDSNQSAIDYSQGTWVHILPALDVIIQIESKI